MRICQLLPTLSRGDAIGNEAVAIREMLQTVGYEAGIYAERVDPRLPEGTGYTYDRMPALAQEDILLYHLSTGSRLNRLMPAFGGRKVIRYHNITPPEFFKPYSPRAYKLGKRGYEEMRFLAGRAERVIAVSGYNRDQLRENGYTCPIDVCPILIPYTDYDREPDPAIMAESRETGLTNLLFVGRITPNKKQEDVIRAFYCYRKRYNVQSRLILAGNPAGMQRYDERLKAYVSELGLDGSVVFTGHTSFPELLARYRTADVFVCMSEHEGFCVPMLEAMHFGKPIVAYRAAAIPDTVGKGALLLDTKDPETAAAAIHRVLNDRDLRNALLVEQQKQLEKYSYDRVRKQLFTCLTGQEG